METGKRGMTDWKLAMGCGRLRSAIGIGLLWVFSLGMLAAGDVKYILEVKVGVDGPAMAARNGLRVNRFLPGDLHWSYLVSAPVALDAAALKRLKGEPGFLELESDAAVSTAESDSVSRAKAVPEALGSWFTLQGRASFYGVLVHSGYVSQPGIGIVNADAAQAKFGKGSGVVAVIDTGVDPAHAALRDVLVPGYDFTRDRSDTVSEWSDVDPATAAALQQSTVEILDTMRPAVVLNATTVAILSQSTVEILDGVGLPKAFGHGTMIAGLVHRIAPEARIMPLKAFRADGTASLSDIVRAIRYAVDHGANVINMSFSFASPSTELQAAIEYANVRGVVCVASAGNNGREIPTYPAAIKQVIGVGSTNFSDRRSPFSNWGSSTRTSAPGEALVTTYPGNTYAGVWGTSFSTALVSGAVVVFQQNTSRYGYSTMKSALDYGVPIEQDMGDARLELLRSITYLRKR